jgi:hypothetical protein
MATRPGSRTARSRVVPTYVPTISHGGHANCNIRQARPSPSPRGGSSCHRERNRRCNFPRAACTRGGTACATLHGLRALTWTAHSGEAYAKPTLAQRAKFFQHFFARVSMECSSNSSVFVSIGLYVAFSRVSNGRGGVVSHLADAPGNPLGGLVTYSNGKLQLVGPVRR